MTLRQFMSVVLFEEDLDKEVLTFNPESSKLEIATGLSGSKNYIAFGYGHEKLSREGEESIVVKK